MSEEFIFSPDKVTASNISALTEKQTVLEERRICELSELADAVAALSSELMSEGMALLDVLSLLSDSPLPMFGKIHGYAMSENISHLSGYVLSLSALDKAIFSELYKERLGMHLIKISEADFLPSSDLPESFVYVKNSFADEAYDVFSQDFSDPRVRYAQSFKDCLKLVNEGEVGYCLLPIEERGVRLPTVAQLLFNGDFKINSVTPVFGFDGNADMKYALVSKSFSVPRLQSDDDRYLEIRIDEVQALRLSDLLLAVDIYGAAIYRVNTVFFDTEDGRRPYYSVIFKDEGREFSSLLTYLTLFAPAYVPIGIYKNLE